MWKIRGSHTTAVVGASVAALALAGIAGCGASQQAGGPPPKPAAATQPAQPQTVHINMTIDGDKTQYSNAFWTVKKGQTVVLTITSNDDGTAPLPNGSPFTQVQGTVGGTELVNGSPVSSVANQDVAHTFTVPGLGLNVVIPAAPKGGTVTVQATFKADKAGTFNWQCEAPCGTGSTGWGGPMATPGYMQGTVTVES
jgi:plastocyanin